MPPDFDFKTKTGTEALEFILWPFLYTLLACSLLLFLLSTFWYFMWTYCLSKVKFFRDLLALPPNETETPFAYGRPAHEIAPTHIERMKRE
jgi:hypothetical protein